MARGSKHKKEEEDEEDPERKRLKSLGFSNKLVSEIPARPQAPLRPSNAVVKHHGKDIIKKSQRKNRFLFSFPGLFAPIAGGKIGDLKDLGTKTPVLYLDFPQGRIKLFGTIVFPKNKYLTLQFPRGGKSVMCEDYFDNMIVFSDAWWIGTKDENPGEAQLDFPKELNEGHNTDYDFKGGAGSASVVNNQSDYKNEITYVDEHSPDAKLEHNLSDDGNKDLIEVTPVRHSARTAGKRFKSFHKFKSPFTYGIYIGPVLEKLLPEMILLKAILTYVKEKITKLGDSIHYPGSMLVEISFSFLSKSRAVQHVNLLPYLCMAAINLSIQTENLSIGDLNIVNEDAVEGAQIPEQNQESSMSEAKSKKQSHSAFSVTISKEDSRSNHGPLVQATISTLFKKVEKKKAGSSFPSQVQTPSQAHKTPRNPRKPASPKVSGQKSLQDPSKRKFNQDGGPSKKGKSIKENDAGQSESLSFQYT